MSVQMGQCFRKQHQPGHHTGSRPLRPMDCDSIEDFDPEINEPEINEPIEDDPEIYDDVIEDFKRLIEADIERKKAFEAIERKKAFEVQMDQLADAFSRLQIRD